MPDERARILADAALKLSGQVSELTAVVETFGRRLKDTEALAKANTDRVTSNERKANLLRTILAFDILITILGIALGWSYFETNNRVDTICPAYAFIIGSYAPQSRTPGPDRDQYNQAFADMRIKFKSLGCGPNYPLVPGAAHPPTASPAN